MRKHLPWWLLLLAFVVVPLVEIYVIIQVGQVIGAWWTIALLVADSILGSWLIRREGSRAWRALRTALDEGRMPARELADGALILIGGTLMLTPGFVSDIFGILCILPFTRPFGRRVLARVISRRLAGVGFPQAHVQWTQQRPGPAPGDGVVQGEVVDDRREPPHDGARP
jgi:UPF0716 protein FxsA